MIMKLALQIGLIPRDTLADRAKWAADHGVEGIELTVFGTPIAGLMPAADQIMPHLPVVSVCGNLTPDGQRGFEFLHPDPAKRRACIDGSKAILDFCGQVGAAGQIVPPIFGPPVVPDLSPVLTALELEEKLMIAACQELGPYAADRKTHFMLEPLNRYEQHYLRRQVDGVRVIKAAGVKGIGLLSDFFHMHIEETNTPAAFKEVAGYTTHIHLADNTRQEPGTGDIDFVASFKVLKAIGFEGYMAYECGISGDSPQKREASLIKSLAYLRDCIAKA